MNDIDEIVKIVRFPGWQSTASGSVKLKKSCAKHSLNITFTQIMISSKGRVGIPGNIIDEDIGV